MIEVSFNAKILSSPYGSNSIVFGQQNQFKSVLIVQATTQHFTVYGEAYVGIYIPDNLADILSIIISRIDSFDPSNPLKFPSLYSIPFVSGSGLYQSVVSAFDQCLWQLSAKYVGVNFVDFLTSYSHFDSSSTFSFYGSGGSVAFSPDECLNDLIRCRTLGLNAFKMRYGVQSLEADFERILLCYKYTDPSFHLALDGIMGTLRNTSYDISQLPLLKLLISSNIFPLWLEEFHDPSSYLAYSHICSNPLFDRFSFALGESFTSLNEYILYSNLVNFFQIDATHNGGFSTSLSVMNYFHEFKPTSTFALHTWGTSIAFLLNFALALSCNIKWVEIPLVNLKLNSKLLPNFDISNYNAIDKFYLQDSLDSISIDNIEDFYHRRNTGYIVPQ